MINLLDLVTGKNLPGFLVTLAAVVALVLLFYWNVARRWARKQFEEGRKR